MCPGGPLTYPPAAQNDRRLLAIRLADQASRVKALSICAGESGGQRRVESPTFRFSGVAYAKSLPVVRVLRAVIARCCQPLAVAVASRLLSIAANSSGLHGVFLRARQSPSQAAFRCRSALLHLLSESGPKLGPEPLDEIAQEGSPLSVVLVSVGRDMPINGVGTSLPAQWTNTAVEGRNAL